MPTRTRAWHTKRVAPRVDFRITTALGPLVAFVPWRYLVLAPRPLWSVLAAEEREAILRHELAHLRRGDLWKSLAIRVLALPQWFNPLAWLAVRRFDEAAEWACDATATRGDAASSLTLAQSLIRSTEFLSSAPGAASFQGGRLSRRIERLVTPRFKEESIMKRLVVPALLALVATAQLIRIERVAAADAPTSPSGSPPLATIPDVRSPSESNPNDATPTSPPRDPADPPPMPQPPSPYIIEAPGVLSIQWAGKLRYESIHGETPISGRVEMEPMKCLVRPDGTIQLGHLGKVYVSGLTTEQARDAVRQEVESYGHVSDTAVTVDVVQTNSKAYYIVTEGISGSDDVVRAPITGNETVLDAVAILRNPSPLGNAKLWIARPAPNGVGVEQKLAIDWDAICRGESMETNYQLMPGDRLFIVPETNERHADLPRTAPAAPAAAPAVPLDGESIIFTLRNEQKRTRAWTVPFKPGMTVSDALGGAVFPNPVDFTDALITLTREQGPEEIGGTTWAIGWDDQRHAAAVDDDRELKPGDEITIDFAKASATPAVPPTPAESEVGELRQIEYQITLLEDRGGDLAEFLVHGDVALRDAATLRSALRIMQKHQFVKSLSNPRIVSAVGRPAQLEIAAPVEGAKKDFHPVQKVNIVCRRADVGRNHDEMQIELGAEITHDNEKLTVECGMQMHEGETALVRFRNAAGQETGPLYVALTPKWVK